MAAAVRRIGCLPVCERCLRRTDDVRDRSRFPEWWDCSRCGEWISELEEASWVHS
jgi:hypothetical protein